MPALVNAVDLASGTGATLMMSGVTPGGSNRAVLVGNLCFAESTNYSDEVQLANSSGTLVDLVDQVEGADVQLDIFSFTFSYAKTYGQAGTPTSLTLVYNHWPTTQLVNAAAAIFLENVDQTTPFGTEQVSTLQFVGSDPQTISDSRTSLLNGQLVVGFLYSFTLGDVPPVSFTAGSGVTLLGTTVNATAENRHVQVIAFSGTANSSGALTASIQVDVPNSGELVVCRMVTWPVNEAAGGPSVGTPSVAVGVATSSTIAGRSTASATPAVAAGAASTFSLSGRSTASATPSIAAGSSITSSLAGRAIAVGIPTVAAGAAITSTLSGRSTAVGIPSIATGVATSAARAGSSIAVATPQIAAGSATSFSLAGAAIARSIPSVAAGVATTASLEGSSTGGGATAIPAAGIATTSTLTGSSIARGTASIASGIATSSTLAGSSLAVAVPTVANGVAATAVLQGLSVAAANVNPAVGIATTSILAGSSVAVAIPAVATGVAITFTLVPVTVQPPAMTSMRVAASWREWVKVTEGGVSKFRLVAQSRVLTSDVFRVLPASIVQVAQ